MPNWREGEESGRLDGSIKLGPATAGDASTRAMLRRPEHIPDLCGLRHPDTAVHAASADDGAYEIHLILNGHCRAPQLRHARQLGVGHIVMRDANEADALNCSDDFDSAIVGEIAILCDVPRTATIKAKEPLSTLKITKDMFYRLVAEFPQMAVEIMRELAHRLEDTNEKLRAATRAA